MCKFYTTCYFKFDWGGGFKQNSNDDPTKKKDWLFTNDSSLFFFLRLTV